LKYFSKIKKRLTVKFHQTGGRNNQGVITVRHRGGGLKRRVRLIDYFKFFYNLQSIVLDPMFYDPIHTSYISLILYKNGVFSFISKPRFLEKGDKLLFTSSYLLKTGNTCPLRVIPEGVFVNSVEYNQGSKGKIARSAGTFVFIINKFSTVGNKVLVRLPSSEEYLLNCNNVATMGRLDNLLHNKMVYKKAGALRRRGIRPYVRGVAMNPIDHPHGGNTSIGRQPVSLWGRYAKGGKTRKLLIKKIFIYKRRK